MAAYQVTLTSANTNYNLLALVRAIDPDFVDGGRVTIESDSANDAENVVMIGDANLSGTRFGYSLAPGQSMLYARDQRVGLIGRWARSGASAQKVNIEVVR